MFGITVDMLIGAAVVFAVVEFVPGVYTWVKNELVDIKTKISGSANTVATTVSTDLSKVITTVDPKAIALAATVKADSANIISNLLKSL